MTLLIACLKKTRFTHCDSGGDMYISPMYVSSHAKQVDHGTVEGDLACSRDSGLPQLTQFLCATFQNSLG